ncbi:hypothetical protein MBLNU230_g7991t1 [Neophaeotheca triangularis]
MAEEERPYQPPWTFRTLSSLNIGTVGFLCKSFLYALSDAETHGLDNFLEILDARTDPERRQRGLVTVSNHTSVLDDPMIWGVLPFRHLWNPNNMRWGLGSYDICFKNGQRSLLSAFFSYGNTLPTHRIAHSPHGGLFQPTMTEVIRLLSDPHAQSSLPGPQPHSSETSFALSDPFSSPTLTYTTTGTDAFPAPSAYPSRRHSWVHIFPEGKIHQHPDKIMRYFKWGVARLILESEPCPDVLPMWIDGPQEVMNENRTWPRPLPRAGKKVTISFGDVVDPRVWEEFRTQWRGLEERARRRGEGGGGARERAVQGLGEIDEEFLRFGEEAQQLRKDVTMTVRRAVLDVRRETGLPDEDPKAGLVETQHMEGGKAEGRMADRSQVKDM